MSFPSITDASESKKKLQCARSRPSSASDRCPGVVAELQKREPAVARLLAEQAERVVLAEELLRRVVRVLAEPVHDDQAAQPSGAAEIGGQIVGVDADAADLVLHRRLVRECVGDERRVGPEHELVVVVGMRLVELRRQRDEVELRHAARTARRPPPAPPAVGPGSLRLTVRKSPVLPGDSPTIASRSGDAGRVNHLDRAARQQRRLDGRRPRRVEPAHVAPGDGVPIRRGVRGRRGRCRRSDRDRRETARRAAARSAAARRCVRCSTCPAPRT